MINLTRLYGGDPAGADDAEGFDPLELYAAREGRPVVVWNLTDRADVPRTWREKARIGDWRGRELRFHECRRVLDHLADFAVPSVFLSGGEPFLHDDFFAIARYAAEDGLAFGVITNGELLDHIAAYSLRQMGCRYVAIWGAAGNDGAFERAMEALAHCRAVGQRAGLRVSLLRSSVCGIDDLLDRIEHEDVRRVSFHHPVDPPESERAAPAEIRQALDRILTRVRRWERDGARREIFTVHQPADGAYVVQRLREENPARAEEVWRRLEAAADGVSSSGCGVAGIDSEGNVHPDPFWRSHTLGNVREKSFGEIWVRSDDELLNGLRDRFGRLGGRCARCRYLRICGGGFRVRAMHAHNDPWAPDPACYLTDDEVLAG